jgi:hypothetical protein
MAELTALKARFDAVVGVHAALLFLSVIPRLRAARAFAAAVGHRRSRNVNRPDGPHGVFGRVLAAVAMSTHVQVVAIDPRRVSL